MPKSKKNTTFNLTKTDKKTRKDKEKLVQEIQNSIDKYSNLYIFKVENFRNSQMNLARVALDGKFYFGSNRVMAKALGSSTQDEYALNLHSVANKLSGNVGLFLSNLDPLSVTHSFEKFISQDYARSGGVATMEYIVKKGPLMRHDMNMPNNMEPLLRKLGLPTELKTGIMVCREDHTICSTGTILNADQAHLLKHFGVMMAEFKLILLSHWQKESCIFTTL